MLLYILFVLGFVLLIKGADWLVCGASSIARKYRLPDIIIGLTIVSFGTSMPELIVNIIASLNGSSDIAVGNVFGSNIANILLILGVAALSLSTSATARYRHVRNPVFADGGPAGRLSGQCCSF